MAENKNNKWPEAAVAIFASLGVCAAAVALQKPEMLWGLMIVALIINYM